MQQLTNFIVVIPNIVPESLCDLVVAEYEKCDEWQDASIASAKNDKEIRNCKIVKIRPSELDEVIFKCTSEALNGYRQSFPSCIVQEDSGYDLLKYTEGGFYTQHIDSDLTHNRSVACSFALNDNFEGGEFAFFNREVSYKVTKGSAIMFPSNFMYPHEILPISSGTRYSIITWFK